MRFRVFFAFVWFDMWIGAYWDRAQRVLYICPLPMMVFALRFPRPRAPEGGEA